MHAHIHTHTHIQGWEQRRDEKNVTGTGKEWWYHWKADELKRANPSGLVPTLMPMDEAGIPNEKRVREREREELFLAFFSCLGFAPPE